MCVVPPLLGSAVTEHASESEPASEGGAALFVLDVLERLELLEALERAEAPDVLTCPELSELLDVSGEPEWLPDVGVELVELTSMPEPVLEPPVDSFDREPEPPVGELLVLAYAISELAPEPEPPLSEEFLEDPHAMSASATPASDNDCERALMEESFPFSQMGKTVRRRRARPGFTPRTWELSPQWEPA